MLKPTLKEVVAICDTLNKDMVQKGAWEEAVPLTIVEFWRHQINNVFDDLSEAEAWVLARKIAILNRTCKFKAVST